MLIWRPPQYHLCQDGSEYHSCEVSSAYAKCDDACEGMTVVEQESSFLLNGKSLHLGCRYPEALHTMSYADDTSQRRAAHRDAHHFPDNRNSKKRQTHARIKQKLRCLLLNVTIH